MNRNHLSPREYRQLSAYLDGELSPQEQARVAQRLASDRRWQTAYRQMQAVKHGLATLPPVHAPRPFTLTPAQAHAARPQRQPRAPRAYRWASALATVLLLIMAAGDLLGHPLPLAAPPPSEVANFQALPANEKALDTTPPVAPTPAESARPMVAPHQPLQGLAIASPTPTPQPSATPIATRHLPPTTAPPPSPIRWPWHLAEAILALTALVLGYLGWRRH